MLKNLVRGRKGPLDYAFSPAIHRRSTMLSLLAADAQGGGRGPWDFFILMGVIFFVMWLLIIRPQKKQEKQRREMIASVRKNDHILTNGGLLGVVTNVKDDEVTIRIDDSRDVKARVSKNFISQVLSRKEGDEE
jgi:preprotein translocase subunit YajC